MFNIRKNVFETNSSSTHSICIAQNGKLKKIPNELSLNLSDDDYEFGWEWRKRNTTSEKLAYLVMGIYGSSYNMETTGKRLDKLTELLKEIGVKEFILRGKMSLSYYGFDDGMQLSVDDCYIDHNDELNEFIDNVLSNSELLKYYLFSDDSAIFTGNDNEDEDYDIEKPTKEEIEEKSILRFYKGN